MRSLILALAASAIATEVTVVWRHEKTTGSTSLSILSAENDAPLAERCGSSLGSLDFTRVDQHGAGNFTIDGDTFDISSKLQDGVSCNRKYNGVIAVTECSGIKFEVPEGEAKSADCFADEDAKASFLALKARAVDATAPTPVEKRLTPSSTFKLRGRQQCHDEKSTVVNGDGDPHQNYFHKQLSVHTVHNHVYNTCVDNERNSDPFVIKSPNKDNRGGGMYCVIGTCRAQGDEYWDNTGRAGGP
ncbi:hypothetical protein P171DRAFT_407521 [Karstenula rhodostoma CBS 690.94]|uniref:Uncharacterized protein n=1 Tax=Karstenula rhodostoma CBS 690.94 TaxID=1392251 RepID=A0A9P4PNU3_9PLEO|nr:hypothetical protein P171DRAFT_407521 [Karstenula rhodostoma CBS 690.94]